MNRTAHPLLRPVLAAGLLLCLAVAAQADDRRLITGYEEIPTVFFLFDTSGSMHWSSQCTQEAFDAGDCDWLCPTGSCFTPANSDSPNSKFYQAKQALYEVIEDVGEELNVGFATFNQDNLRLFRKHWLYEALEDGPTITGWGAYPQGRTTDGSGNTVYGDWHVFGESWSCTDGPGPDDQIGCTPGTPADLVDRWERERVGAWPKENPQLNSNSSTSYTNWIRHAGTTWEIRIRLLSTDSNDLGNPTIRTRVRRRRCLDGSCASTDMSTEKVVDFGLVTDFAYWDFTTTRGPAQAGFFNQGTASDSPAGNTCAGWDPNTDTANDIFSGYNARFPTTVDVTFPGLLDVGDVLPVDWRQNNRQKLLQRLAPNLALGETTPDFRVARYFEDIVDPSDELHLKNEAARPIHAFGATPIGASVEAFSDWLVGPTGTGGWVAAAEANDPSFTCRSTYLIVLTDGDETCGGNPCTNNGTAGLFDDFGVKTYVVAFGVRPHVPILPSCTGDPDEVPGETCCESAGSTCIPTGDPTVPPEASRDNRFLRCMAATGGTGREDWDGDGTLDSEDGTGVIYPQNRQELVDALVSILDQIKPAPVSFSTAAVPSVQAEAADKVFLSEFTPVPERSHWMGRVNAFLKPLPVDENNKPDTTVICPNDDIEDPTDDPSACLLWEVGDVILANQVNPGDPVGDLAGQRRVYYSEFGDGGVPLTRHFFEETIDGTTPLGQEFDLWRGFDLDFDPLDPSTYGDARDDANTIVDDVVGVKTTPVNEDFPVAVDYLIGDIFHSDPLLLGSPNNLLYFFEDLHGYREFALRHGFRRRILMFGTNGGVVHGIDAGVCRELVRDDPRPCLFDNGSGRELFGYVPRIAMPSLARMSLDPVPRHRYAADGRTQAADVRIDPVHQGARSAIDPPLEDDREWRTVLIGGMREGGNLVPEDIGDLSSPADSNPADTTEPKDQWQSGYYALDVTQPDPLEDPLPANRPPIPEAVGVEPPSCLRTVDGKTPIDPACGPIAFAAPLWEFTDTIEGVRLDEDDNGHVDLAFAWSNPNMGRIRVCTAACDSATPTLEDRYVTIFGGGYDPRSPFQRGNYLYMIDIETGETIYKHELLGAAASEPAAVDTDFDGYLDTVYIGTTLGLLYRANLGPFDDDGDPSTAAKFPPLELQTITEVAVDATVVSHDVDRIVDSDFGPYVLLQTSDPLAIPPEVRPIFFRPSIAYVPEFNKYAVAVGTGHREDIFRRDQPTGRFFVFVDNVSQLSIMDPSFTPFSPTSPALTPLTPSSPRLEQTSLLRPGEGWWLELQTNERVVTEPFALSGILFFSTFIPDPDGPEIIPENSLCREKGVSNIYGVFTTNADGLLSDNDDIDNPDDLVRYVTVEGLVSSPFTEQSQTKNPPPDEDVDIIDDLSARLEYVRDRLKQQFPENCTFPPGYRIDVKTRNSGTSIDFIAPVPICVVEKNFREF